VFLQNTVKTYIRKVYRIKERPFGQVYRKDDNDLINDGVSFYVPAG